MTAKRSYLKCHREGPSIFEPVPTRLHNPRLSNEAVLNQDLTLITSHVLVACSVVRNDLQTSRWNGCRQGSHKGIPEQIDLRIARCTGDDSARSGRTDLQSRLHAWVVDRFANRLSDLSAGAGRSESNRNVPKPDASIGGELKDDAGATVGNFEGVTIGQRRTCGRDDADLLGPSVIRVPRACQRRSVCSVELKKFSANRTSN